MIDTHAHFDRFEAEGITAAVIERAQTSGVTGIMAVGSSHESNRLVVRLMKQFPGFLCGAVGYDRDQACSNPSIAALDDLLSANPRIRAVGEIGLDYHYQADTARQQRALFVQMLDLARKHDKPVSIHSREADADTLAILDEHIQERGNGTAAGILHCFTGSGAFANQLVERGLYISFSGIITFNSAADLRETMKSVPEKRLLVETDCPYLTPAPHRGEQNEPAMLVHTLKNMSDFCARDFAEMEQITSANARALLKM